MGKSGWRALLNDTDELEKIAKKVQNKSLEEMSEIFDIASSVLGIAGSRSDLEHFQKELTRISDDEAAKTAVVFKEYLDLNLDLSFSKYKTDLANARVIVTSLSNYFDEIFGHKKVIIRTIDQSISPFVFVGIGVGAFLLIMVVCLMIYGCTEHGRKTFKTYYLYYYGSIKAFENRWRYSMFLDAIDGKNAILDAVRERNKPNLLKALQNGAFVDVYNKFGNTALHVATKNAQPDLVKLLIKHGADQSLLNHKNLLPEQMLISKHRETPNDRKEEYEEIRKIYNKYRKKNTRSNVPQQFPVSSFHIWMDEKTDDKLTNAFMEKFPSITSDEAMLTTTHVVVKVNPAGVLETDDLSLLVWIFNGAIIVKEKWMTDCLSDEKLIAHDSKYLVKKVQYKGTTYDTILAWSQAMAKGQIPYMLGVCVVVCMEKCKSLYTISQLVTSQGGLMCNSFPKKEDFDVEARPYLHAHLGPLFVIHDGKMNLEPYRNDRDKMYTCFTETEFIQFMLKRDIYKDPRDDPVNLFKEGEA